MDLLPVPASCGANHRRLVPTVAAVLGLLVASLVPVGAGLPAPVNAAQGPALGLEVTADVAYFDEAGDVIGYSFTLTNTGDVTLSAPYRIRDEFAVPPVDCPAVPTSLAPGDSVVCDRSYAVTQQDVDAGSVTNKAIGYAALNGAEVDSNIASLTVGATRLPELSLDKTADVTSFDEVGDVILYTLTLTSTGNVTLSAPFSVDDSLLAQRVPCPGPASLAPGQSFTCGFEYTVTQPDLDAGSITNHATAHATFEGRAIDSQSVSMTIDKAPTWLYEFSGFYQPVDNAKLNVAKAGSAIPVKFSLDGDQGLDIFEPGYPNVVPGACPGADAPSDLSGELATARASSLTYDAASGQYVYEWMTSRAWATGCYTFDLGLIDGSSHTFMVQFRK